MHLFVQNLLLCCGKVCFVARAIYLCLLRQGLLQTTCHLQVRQDICLFWMLLLVDTEFSRGFL